MKLSKDATNPFYTILHPFDCSWDIRFKQKGSYVFAGMILAVMFLTSIFQRQSTGYIFNYNNLGLYGERQNQVEKFKILIRGL